MVGSAIERNYSTIERADAINLLILSQLEASAAYATIAGCVPCCVLARSWSPERRPFTRPIRWPTRGACTTRDSTTTPSGRPGRRCAFPRPRRARGVVLGRIQLERYRRSSAPAELSDAIAALTAPSIARRLDARERIELHGRPRRGAISRGSIRRRRRRCSSRRSIGRRRSGPVAHGRVLDWWATALDRQAQTRPPAERQDSTPRLGARMAAEIAKDRRIAARRTTGWRRPRAAPAISTAR